MGFWCVHVPRADAEYSRAAAGRGASVYLFDEMGVGLPHREDIITPRLAGWDNMGEVRPRFRTTMLPKQHRLKSRGDFMQVFKGPLRARMGSFSAVCRQNNTTISRFGFVVSLAVSKKAVTRNKLRRQLHEVVRHLFPTLSPGYDCVIRTYPGAEKLVFEEIKRCVEGMLWKVGIFRK